MRTLGFRTHVLLALAAATGVLYSLGRPWYATPPAEAPGEGVNALGDPEGSLNMFVEGVRRWVTEPLGTTGWEALDHWGVALAAMAGVVMLGALLSLAPAAQHLGRDLLRYGAFAVMAIAVWKLLDPPGANEAFELRRGALVCTAAAIATFVCASSAAAAPLRRRAVSGGRAAAPQRG